MFVIFAAQEIGLVIFRTTQPSSDHNSIFFIFPKNAVYREKITKRSRIHPSLPPRTFPYIRELAAEAEYKQISVQPDRFLAFQPHHQAQLARPQVALVVARGGFNPLSDLVAGRETLFLATEVATSARALAPLPVPTPIFNGLGDALRSRGLGFFPRRLEFSTPLSAFAMRRLRLLATLTPLRVE